VKTAHRPRRLLVTGGAGFIGANFVLQAFAARPDWHIVILDKLTYAADPTNLADISARRHRFVHGDICDFELVKVLILSEKIDTVVHFAAESHVDRSIASPDEFIRTNVLGTHVLLEACRAAWGFANGTGRGGVRFHHISTDEVFGTLAEGDPPFCETTGYAPNSPYSASKAAADHLVRAYARTYGLPAIVTNCSNNYGPRQHPEKFIPTVIRTALAGQPIPVYGSGLNRRDWLFVDDHCAALIAALECAVDGARYCIGGGDEIANIELARRICAILDQRRPCAVSYKHLIAYVPDRPGHDFRYAIDSTKIRQELAWIPQTNVDDGLRRTIDWYLERSRTAAPVSEPYHRPPGPAAVAHSLPA